jgi:hypothetical protein
MKNYVVYATGVGVHPAPNDPCFRVTVQANSRREAIEKAVKANPALANAHRNCHWEAHVQ